MPLENRHFFEFGPFHIDTAERRLRRGDEPIPLTPKAYETLLALVENAGRGLKKEELMQRVWPDSFVEESSLTRNISVLRKVLGDEDGRYIETLPKHGYRFAAPVEDRQPPAETVVVEEHALARLVIEETESTNWRLPSVRVTAVIVLAIAAVALAYLATRRNPPVIRSVAVLPLKDLAGGGDHQELELGIADSIIGRMGEVSGLTVRPIGAVRKYRGPGTDPLQAGRELKVDAVLDGSLRAAGDRTRVSLNLIETSKGASLWSQVFEVPLSNIFDVEDEVTRQVARQLRLHLDGAWQAHVARRSTRNEEAYEHYLKGLYSIEAPATSQTVRPSIEAAIARFRKATELDPSYAPAWAQLAICYNKLEIFYQPDRDFAEEASKAADRASTLDPNLPELLVYRAQALWSWNSHYRIEEAIRELRRPSGYSSSEVLSFLGVMYWKVGLDRQSIAVMKRALEIDPSNSLYLDRLAAAYIWTGQYDEAHLAYHRALALESEANSTLVYTAIPFLYARQFDEARRRLETARGFGTQSRLVPVYMALLAALEGKFQEAEGVIPSDTRELEKFRDSQIAFYTFASIFALQGKSGEAVRWLRKTVEMGMPDYPLFARDPNLNRVRASTEFGQFMAELKPRYEAVQREFR